MRNLRIRLCYLIVKFLKIGSIQEHFPSDCVLIQTDICSSIILLPRVVIDFDCKKFNCFKAIFNNPIVVSSLSVVIAERRIISIILYPFSWRESLLLIRVTYISYITWQGRTPARASTQN